MDELLKKIIALAIEQAKGITDDQVALEYQVMYKEWSKQIGREVAVGEYIQHEGRLFRVLQAHTIQEDWIPGEGTESLFVVIDKEHEGTIEDPIPAQVNMEYFKDKYYLEGDVLYLCTRDSEIALHFLPSQLIGHYFELALQ